MRPPGQLIRRLLAALLDPTIATRVVDAAVADVQAEWLMARSAGAQWRAGWIRVRGSGTLLLLLPRLLYEDLRLASATERGRLNRSMSIALVSGLAVMAALFGFALLNSRFLRAQPLSLLALHIPQLLAIAIPVGLTVGIIHGHDGTAVSRRVATAIMSVATAASLCSFFISGWIGPSGNRVFIAAVAPAVTGNAAVMTTGELWKATRHPEPRAPVVAYVRALHFRSAMSLASVSLAALALCLLAGQPDSRIIRAATTLLVVGGYWFLLERADSLARQGVLPAFFAAWSATVVCGLLTILMLLRRHRALQPTPASQA
jgi:hypothetical protein